MMIKRGNRIGSYDTAVTGKWLLTQWNFSDPVLVTHFVDVPGRKKGPLDLSTVLTDGDPVYGSRTFTAIYESSEGSRLEREARISSMVNSLDGWTHHITLPDDDTHYIVGRVQVQRLYNDMAHGSVQVTAICEPWKYNNEETTVTLKATTEPQTATLPNLGRMAVVPLLKIEGSDVLLSVGGSSWALSPGTYTLPDLLIPQGGKVVNYSGNGTLTLTYREAVL